jgi:hypothetical protein
MPPMFISGKPKTEFSAAIVISGGKLDRSSG